MNIGPVLMIFSKAPEPGMVKTRLIGTLGASGAAELHRSMARHCIAQACAALPGRVELWCTPSTAHPFFRECAATWNLPLREQVPGGLGQRMSDAFGATLRHAPAALLMGTDVPSILSADLTVAMAALDAGKDAVFCPTEDGGYGLIGLRRHHPRLFSGIDWGTRTVMAQTRDRLAELGWDWYELPVRWDVDEPQDIARLAGLEGFRGRPGVQGS